MRTRRGSGPVGLLTKRPGHFLLALSVGLPDVRSLGGESGQWERGNPALERHRWTISRHDSSEGRRSHALIVNHLKESHQTLGSSRYRGLSELDLNRSPSTVRELDNHIDLASRLISIVHNRLFAFWGVGVVFEVSRGSWTVSWDDDRTQEFALGASSTKTRT